MKTNILTNTKNLLRKSKLLLEKVEIIRNNSNKKVWIDNDTNLIWEFKTENNIHEIFNIEESYRYCEKLNENKYAGYNTWSIPTIEELKSISENERTNDYFIKEELAFNTDWAYWSSSVKDGKQFVFYFINREIRLESKKFKCYLRCVMRDNCEQSNTWCNQMVLG